MVVTFERSPTNRPRFGDILGFDQTFDSLFDGFLTSPAVLTTRFAPVVDVAEYPTETVVVAELPGVDKEEVKLSFEKGTLTISGERKPSAIPGGSKKIRNERYSGSFLRAIAVEEEINPDGITAELTNGILKVTLPKAEKARAREITIR